jgi:hypothetical protein
MAGNYAELIRNLGIELESFAKADPVKDDDDKKADKEGDTSADNAEDSSRGG